MLVQFGAAVAGSFLAGFFIARRIYRRRLTHPAGLLLPAPRNEEQYEKARGFYIEMYRASMQQYDKLVPWAAGGALVLSTTLLHDIALATGSTETRALLGLSWLFLFVSLISSVAGHFTSSRIYSSARAALDLVHGSSLTEADKLESAEHYRIAHVNDRITYWLNYAAGGALLLGLGFLGVWAFLSLF